MPITGCCGLNCVPLKDDEVLTTNACEQDLTWKAFIDVVNLKIWK